MEKNTFELDERAYQICIFRDDRNPFYTDDNFNFDTPTERVYVDYFNHDYDCKHIRTL